VYPGDEACPKTIMNRSPAARAAWARVLPELKDVPDALNLRGIDSRFLRESEGRLVRAGRAVGIARDVGSGGAHEFDGPTRPPEETSGFRQISQRGDGQIAWIRSRGKTVVYDEQSGEKSRAGPEEQRRWRGWPKRESSGIVSIDDDVKPVDHSKGLRRIRPSGLERKEFDRAVDDSHGQETGEIVRTEADGRLRVGGGFLEILRRGFLAGSVESGGTGDGTKHECLVKRPADLQGAIQLCLRSPRIPVPNQGQDPQEVSEIGSQQGQVRFRFPPRLELLRGVRGSVSAREPRQRSRVVRQKWNSSGGDSDIEISERFDRRLELARGVVGFPETEEGGSEPSPDVLMGPELKSDLSSFQQGGNISRPETERFVQLGERFLGTAEPSQGTCPMEATLR